MVRNGDAAMLKLNCRSLPMSAQDNSGGGGSKTDPGGPEFNLGPGKKSPYVRNLRGKILYIGDDDKERGREWFSFSFREDGEITLRAYCEIDDGRVERDVVYTMDANLRPIDCFNRLHSGGRFLGSGWIRVNETNAQCEVFNTSVGRVTQTVALDSPALVLGSHPLSCDALAMVAYDHANPERIQVRPGKLMTSPRLDGGSGPMISVGNNTVEYVGEERIETAVGTFDTHHYRFPESPGESPHESGTKRSQDVWVTHPDYIFVRAEVHGYLRNPTGFGRYELVEFDD
jgi:hypothetical protein